MFRPKRTIIRLCSKMKLSKSVGPSIKRVTVSLLYLSALPVAVTFNTTRNSTNMSLPNPQFTINNKLFISNETEKRLHVTGSARHEGIWRSGGIAPLTLNSELNGDVWSSCPGRFTSRRRVPVPINMGLAGPLSQSGRLEEEKMYCTCLGFNPVPRLSSSQPSHYTD